MNKNQATEKFLKSGFITVVELRAVEARVNAAKPEKNKGESHYLNYNVLIGNDSAEVKHYAKKGANAAPQALAFERGQRAVVEGVFEKNAFGISCMARSIELLTD